MWKVDAQEVCALLRPYLGGEALEANEDFLYFLSGKLTGYPRQRPSFEQLREALEQDLVKAVYTFSKRTMNLRMDDGTWRHFVLADFYQIADALMESVFARLCVGEESYRELLEYASMHPSLSALKTLYLRYKSYVRDEERAILIRLITEQYDPLLYERWLSPADCPKRGA